MVNSEDPRHWSCYYLFWRLSSDQIGDRTQISRLRDECFTTMPPHGQNKISCIQSNQEAETQLSVLCSTEDIRNSSKCEFLTMPLTLGKFWQKVQIIHVPLPVLISTECCLKSPLPFLFPFENIKKEIHTFSWSAKEQKIDELHVIGSVISYIH